MCYATKRKIADCVKGLMRHKDISKITIQDIMDGTHMSRQSFYYHFKDIYDVLEWIGKNDFEQQLSGNEYAGMEEWVCDLLKVLRKEHVFYEKLVNEIEWPNIVKSIKKPIEEQVIHIFAGGKESLLRSHQEELSSCVDFFSTSFCYYMLDYVYRKRDVPDSKVINDVRFMTMMLEGSQMVPANNSVTVFPKMLVV